MDARRRPRGDHVVTGRARRAGRAGARRRQRAYDNSRLLRGAHLDEAKIEREPDVDPAALPTSEAAPLRWLHATRTELRCGKRQARHRLSRHSAGSSDSRPRRSLQQSYLRHEATTVGKQRRRSRCTSACAIKLDDGHATVGLRVVPKPGPVGCFMRVPRSKC